MKVRIPHIVNEKFKVYASTASTGKEAVEVACWGLVRHDDDDNFIVGDVFLVKQENTVCDVDMDATDHAMLVDRLDQEGKDTNLLRLSIHAHPSSGPKATFFSGTDINNIERHLTMLDWLVSVVTDCNGEHPRARLDVSKPFNLSIDLPVVIDYPRLTEAAESQLRAEVGAKVSRQVLAPIKMGNGKGKGNGGTVITPHSKGYSGWSQSIMEEEEEEELDPLLTKNVSRVIQRYMRGETSEDAVWNILESMGLNADEIFNELIAHDATW